MSRSAHLRAARLLIFCVCTILWVCALLAGATLRAQANPVVPTPLVVKLTIHDTVQPISAQYLHRGLAEAASEHAALVILSLDTPGGLLDSTRTMVADIERSPVPVAVFISPTGARAGSAGFFLLEAADVAAMAPGSNAGASHPILEGRTLDPILKMKLENDAAAFLRSVTPRRDRNPEAAETAVRDSKSYSDTEALKLKLIDLVVPDDAALLQSLDGRTIHRFDGSAHTLHLTGFTLRSVAPSFRESFLTRLTDPNLAVLLLIAGVLLIYLEFHVPGTIIPGSLGAFFVLLALFGLNLLPVSHTAIALVLAGAALMLAEFKLASHGILAFAGIVSLVFGLATLVDAPIREMQVHPSTAIAAGCGFGAITFLLAWLALRARRNKVLLGPQAMIGKLAVARTTLAPSGQVEVRGELWQATLRDSSGSVTAGHSVLILEAEGLRLLVEPSHSSKLPVAEEWIDCAELFSLGENSVDGNGSPYTHRQFAIGSALRIIAQ
jgi:membrane-bound serine protease (ClpP class)